MSADHVRDELATLASSPESQPGEAARLRSRYIDLMERALTHLIYRPLDIHWEENTAPDDYAGSEELRAAAAVELAREDFDWASVRADGRDWPYFAQTMVGLKRLANVRQCVERVIADGVPGDLIETGVWRGGVVILMRAILEAYDQHERTVFAADSFQGVPPPNASIYPSDAGSHLHTASALAVPRDEVERNFDLYGLLDDQVRFLEGWFKDSLPTVKERTWAVVRLDGDLYESTMDALTNLYPGLSVGGFLIIDDYGHDPCRQAVADFRDAQGVTESIESIDWLGAFWRRTR
jgi:O-methyltransferase